MRVEEKVAGYVVLKTPQKSVGWYRARLSEIADIVRGVTYKKEQASEQPATGKLPVLRATNVQDGTLVLNSNLVYVPVELVSYTQKLQVGDIVVATSSGSKHLVGKTAQVREPWVGSFGAFCAAIRPTAKIDHRYLGYFFETREYKDYIRKKALGVNINNLRRGDLEEILVPVAPPDQQTQIVAEIEKQFSRLDDAIANLKRVKANLKRYKASVLKAAVEGRMVEIEAEIARREGRSYETGEQLLQRILETRRSQWQGKGKYKEPAAPDTTDLPELPEGWVWALVDQLAEVVRGASPRPAGDPKYFGGTIPWITVGPITAADGPFLRFVPDSVTELGKANSRYIEAGTLLLTNSGATLGVPKITLISGCINDGVAALLGVGDPLKMYLTHYLSSLTEMLRRINQGAAQPNLNTSIIRAIYVPLPPSPEQHRIVAEIDRHISLANEAEAQVNGNLKRAERLRQTILSRCFSGGKQ